MAEKKKHAKLSPSGAHRWMACPGSIALCEDMPDIKSDDAEEGTVAHRLVEVCLQAELPAKAYLNKELDVPDLGNRRFKIDEEMVEAAQLYLDTINSDKQALGSSSGLCGAEVKFDLSWLYPGIFGSNDYFLYNAATKHLTVYDYKHGVGVSVDAEWNPQLMIYALGAMKEVCDTMKETVFDKAVETVELVIVQPRDRHSDEKVKRWSISSLNLLFWGLNVMRPCAIAAETKQSKFCAGEHCRFCKALSMCQEVRNNALELAKANFDEPEINSISLITPDNLDPEEIVKVMNIAPVLSQWADAVKDYAFTVMSGGTKIPGYKLVQKKANRRWISDTEVKDALYKKMGDDIYSPVKLLSVAQMETAAKKYGVEKNALKDLWEKPDAGLTIAPESDKREAVEVITALDFLDEADDLDFL